MRKRLNCARNCVLPSTRSRNSRRQLDRQSADSVLLNRDALGTTSVTWLLVSPFSIASRRGTTSPCSVELGERGYRNWLRRVSTAPAIFERKSRASTHWVSHTGSRVGRLIT